MTGQYGLLNGAPPDQAAWFSTALRYLGLTIEAGWPAAGLLQLIWTAAMFLIVFTLPNTQQFILGVERPAGARLAWQPTMAWAACLGLLFGVSLTYSLTAANRVSEFIYFIF
jgi:hypothetical protein